MLRAHHIAATALFGWCMLTGCHRPLGAFQYRAIESRAEQRRLHYGVHEPPGWDGKTALPLVLLLHGAGDNHESADRKSVVRALDAAMARGDVPPVLVVTPEGERGFWVDWADGTHSFRSWVLDDVLTDVRAHYPVLPGPEGLHLLGVSMGGGGGLQMWLREPARFGSASILSAPILNDADTRSFLRHFTTDSVIDRIFGPMGQSRGLDPFVTIDAPEALAGSHLLFGAAQHDYGGILASNRAFHESLLRRGVPHRFVEFAGRHGWRSWAPVFPYALCQQLRPDCPMQPP